MSSPRNQANVTGTRVPTAIVTLLGTRLGSLSATARAHAALTARARALLPDDVAAHLLGVVDSPQALQVFVDSPAWATRIRFLLPNLQHGLEGRSRPARVRVLPPDAPPAAPVKETRRPSSAAVGSVSAAAASSTTPGLSAAFSRLAATLARRQLA